MTTANYSVNFSAVLSPLAGNVNPLDVACLDAAGAGYLLANAANKGTRKSSGIVLAAGSYPGNVPIQTSGQIDGVLPPLAGLEQFARVSTAGRLERVITPSPGDEIVGMVDSFGNVRLNFAGGVGGVSVSRVIALDPSTYGLVADGVTDNYAAFNAMLGTIPYPPNGVLYSILFSPGTYYFSDRLLIKKLVQLLGFGGSDNGGATTFLFAPLLGATGSGVIFTDDGVTAADSSQMFNITVKSTVLHPGLSSFFVSNNRTPNTNYRKNDVVNYFISQGTGASITSSTTTTMNVSGLSGMAGSVGNLLYLFGAFPSNSAMSFLIVAASGGGTSVDVQQLGNNAVAPDPHNGAISWIQYSPYFFRAAAAGRSATTGAPTTAVLAAMAAVTAPTATSGLTITDGTIAWSAEAFASPWRASQTTRVGDRCYALGDTRATYECAVAGTTAINDYALLGAATPSQASPTIDIPGPGYYGDTFTDGTVTWRKLIHAGVILNGVQIQVNNVFVGGFTNHGFLVSTVLLSSGSSTFADFCSISNSMIEFCGLGIGTDGGDANALVTWNVTGISLGTDRQSRDVCWGDGTGVRRKASTGIGTGAHMVWDRGSGNAYTNMYCQNSFSNAYFSSGTVSHATYLNCLDECTLGNFGVNAGSVFFGGGMSQRSDSQATAVLGQRSYNIMSTSRTLTNDLQCWPGMSNAGVNDTRDAFQVPAESGDFFGWLYAVAGGGVSTQSNATQGTGWHAYQSFKYVKRFIAGVSGALAAEGSGNARLYSGIYLGNTSPYLLAVDSAAWLDPGFRGGQRLVGDRYEPKSNGVAAGYIGSVVVTAGYRAQPWAAGLSCYPVANGGTPGYQAQPATTVEPTAGGTYVYVFTSGGGAALPEPAAPGTLRWTAGATVALNDLVLPTHASWNGYAYKATSIGAVPHQTGGAQPTWPTSAASTVVDGDITWTRQNGAWGNQAGEITNDAGGAVWTWLGPVCVVNRYGLIV